MPSLPQWAIIRPRHQVSPSLLFNSFTFFVFLTIVILGAICVQHVQRHWLPAFLIGVSFLFYLKWNPSHLPILLASILLNFAAGHWIARSPTTRVVGFVIACNIALLGYFKYMNWLSQAALDAGLWKGEPTQILLPLAISFFTFEQISYLIDIKRGHIQPARLRDYLFFVSFFPKLIAGPIVRYSEIYHQIARIHISVRSLSIGLTLFALGLGKKIVLADQAAVFVAPVFDAARQGTAIGFVDAWSSALAYTFQLYFDFSAYSDMAIGIALIFGIALPINFYSPYQSANIIEFWRRWHMTLSRFLRDYLYFSLGGSRHGPLRRYLNLIAVMTIGGLWHGAGLTFIIWGLMHGLYLALNHGYRSLLPQQTACLIGHATGWFLTFTAVVFGWVFFRADGIQTAWVMITAMLSPFQESRILADQATLLMTLLVMLAICLFLPNTNQIMGRDVIDPDHNKESLFPEGTARPLLSWRPTAIWGILIGILLANLFFLIWSPSPFLYFNF